MLGWQVRIPSSDGGKPQLDRKRELRDMVESNEEQTKCLRKELQEKEVTVRDAQASLERLAEQLRRALPFEQEVKEKNLLIGKLRHEAVILNDHLTKALRFLRKGRPEDNVDRSVVSHGMRRVFFANGPHQANRHESFSTLPGARPRRSQKISDPSTHRSLTAVDRR